jgi:O-acetylhomoserine (thiol)-lyase
MKLETLAIHGSYTGKVGYGATVVPLYQTVAYSYSTARELADVFAGTAPGYIYTRIANPTTLVLEARLAELEEGIGCIATSSGMAAIASVVMGLLEAGDEIISSRGIFGGTISLFERTMAKFGVITNMVDVADTENFSRALNDRTKLVFVETISNPRMDVPDVQVIADITRQANIPLVVDNTVTTPCLIKPVNFGADIVVHSTSKFINGHGTAIGGAIIDTGNYDWSNGRFEDIRELSEKNGRLAFLAYLRNVIYRDIGGCPAPINSFLMLQGLETLPIRMAKHCDNAKKLAEFLQGCPNVRWVNYPGLPENRFNNRVVKQFGNLGGGLLTFGLKNKQKAYKFIDSLRLARNAANLGDAKTLVIHPASTIFHEFSAERRQSMGITEDMIRVSVGIEDFKDIREDFEQAIEKTFEE